MRILVNDYAGHPFQIDLSRNLASNGFNVLHTYCNSIQTPRGQFGGQENVIPSLCIKSITLSKQIQKNSFFERRNLEVEYGKLLSKEIDNFNPDIIIVSNTPVDAQEIIWKKCKKKNVDIIYWLQDIQSIAIEKIVKTRIPIIGYFISKYYYNLEKKQLLNSKHIVSISKGFNNVLLKWGIKESNITYIPNWAPINEISVLEKNNEWARKFNLTDKKVVLYSGTLGFKHNPDLLKKLSVALQYEEDSVMVVISEGLGQEYLKKEKKDLKLNNLILLPYQDFSKMSEVMASSDILIGILEKDAGTFSVPSKVLTYLCSKRAIVLSVPLNNLSGEIVQTANAGLVIEPDNDELFIKSVLSLLKDDQKRKLYGGNARFYAETNFISKNILLKFIKVLDLVTNTRNLKLVLV